MSDNNCPTCKANPIIGDGYCPTCHRSGKLDEWVKSLPAYQPKPLTERNEKAMAHAAIVARLRVIANAIADGNYSELTMRIPAEPDRDADIVVTRAAERIAELEAELNDVELIGRAAIAALEQQRDALLAALNSALEIVEHDRCDGESEFASGVNAACERHATGIRNLINKVKP